VPASYLGRQVRCNGCSNPFEAVSNTTGATHPLAREGIPGVVTVVAREAGSSTASPWRLALWIAAAAAAFLLPVAGAVFVAIHPRAEGPGDALVPIGELYGGIAISPNGGC
jgi:hypothetical protein